MFKEVAFFCASPLRLKTLTFFMRRNGVWGSVLEVASVLGVPREQVQRELGTLARAGILKTKKVKRHTLFSVNDRHPFVAPLRAFVASTCVPDDGIIARIFRPFRGVVLVVASGLLANEPKSPVDLLIVSKKPDVRALEKAVKKVEHAAALPLRYAVLEALEYQERRQSYDRLLRDVFDYGHRIVLEKSS